MITIPDLQAAIAECQGERNPNANTCIKLAAYYTILDHVQEKQESTSPVTPAYSFSPEPQRTAETYIDYNSGTEFSAEIDGLESSKVWPVMDELMDVLQATQPRLYRGVLNQIRGI